MQVKVFFLFFTFLFKSNLNIHTNDLLFIKRNMLNKQQKIPTHISNKILNIIYLSLNSCIISSVPALLLDSVCIYIYEEYI